MSIPGAGAIPLPPELQQALGGLPPLPGVGQPGPMPLENIQPSPQGIGAMPTIPSSRTRKLKLRLPDYELKKAHDGKRPSRQRVDWIVEEAKRRKSHWSLRDSRMDLDEQLYIMLDAKEAPDKETGEESVVRGTPRNSVNKLAYMVGRQKDKIKVQPRLDDAEYKEAAQNIEDFLYHMRKRANEKHQSKLKQSLGHDEAWHAAVRGWLVSRVSLDPGHDMPVKIDLYDARNCYPQMGESGPGMMMNMIYAETTTKSAFIAMHPDLRDEPYIEDLESDDEIEFIWYEDEYYSMIVIDDVLVDSEVHDYGFCPWVVTISGGPPVENELTRGQVGCGMLTPVRHIIKQMDRMLSAVSMGLARYGNPTVVRKRDTQKQAGAKYPEWPKLYPGGKNEVDEGQGQAYELLQPSIPPMETQLIFDALQDDINKGGIIPVLWGTAESMASGYQQAVATNAAEDALFPVTDCIIPHRQWQNKLALNLILCADDKKIIKSDAAYDEEDQPVSGVYFQKRRRPRSPREQLTRDGASVGLDVLTIRDIELHGVDNDVLLRRMTPQDIFQMVQAGAAALQSDLLDPEFIRSEWLDVDDPEAMNLRIIFSKIFRDEEMMKEVFMPIALMNDDVIFNLYMTKLQERKQREAMEMQSGMMGGGAPLPGQGMPAEMVPPPMQPQPFPGAGDPAAIAAMQATIPGVPGAAW